MAPSRWHIRSFSWRAVWGLLATAASLTTLRVSGHVSHYVPYSAGTRSRKGLRNLTERDADLSPLRTA